MKPKNKNIIYGILTNRKGYVNAIGLFKSEKKAKDNFKILEEGDHHQAILFEYNLRTGKGKTLRGVNAFPWNFVFFRELKLKKTVEVTK